MIGITNILVALQALLWMLLAYPLTALEKDQEAAALFAARDYYHAAEIYEKMLHQDLPPWEMAAVQYNLGTTKLALQDWEGARHQFQSIPPDSIASPYLLVRLVENIGLTYLVQAEEKSDDIEMQIYMIKLGIYYIEQAQQINCEWQQAEKKHQTICTPSAEFDIFHRQGLLQLLKTRQRQREALVSSLPKMKNDPGQILAFESQMLLLDDPLSLSLAEKLVETHLNVRSAFPSAASFEQGSHLLNTGLSLLKAQNDPLARYYFLSYRYLLEETSKEKSEPSSTPITVLREAISTAKKALFLHRLTSLANPPETMKKEIDTTLIKAQQGTVEQSAPFIPAVLKQEVERFRKIGEIRFTRCQEHPWEKVLPLFEIGYQNAQSAYQSNLSPAPQSLHRQEETVQNWQKALKLLEENETKQPEESNQSPEATQKLLQSLQEMELEDKPEKPFVPLESHTW